MEIHEKANKEDPHWVRFAWRKLIRDSRRGSPVLKRGLPITVSKGIKQEGGF